MLMIVEAVVAGGILYGGWKIITRRSQRKALIQHLVESPPSAADDELPAPKMPKGEEQILAMEKEINQFLLGSSAALAVGLVGSIFYPPLMLLTVGAVIYASIPMSQMAVISLRQGRISTFVADVILTAGMLLTGHVILAAATAWFATLAMKLLLKTENNSRKKLINIFGEQPRMVWIQQGQTEIQIPFEQVQVGDCVVVNAGEMIPVDGTIIDGLATVDQQMLTGEAQPVEKEAGDTALAATVVLAGRIYIQVEKAGKETVAAKIGDILNNTTDYNNDVMARGQKLADDLTWPTLVVSGLTWPLLGLNQAVAILWASFGYTMRLISPISVLNFLQILSQQGVLVKDGRSLEALSQVDTIVFDKTGTLTVGIPHVGQIYTTNNWTESEILTVAAAAEYRQSHPIAKAILDEANVRGLNLPTIEEAAYEVGYGIKVKLADSMVRVGSARFMAQEGIALTDEIHLIQNECHEHGYSLVYVAIDGQLGGAIQLQPTIRPEAKAIIHGLRERGMSLYIISGDHEKPTRTLAQTLGIDHYFAETLPENKADLVDQLRQEGKFVCFVGDGINDSIALKKANISVSLSGASTAATDTAHIILMDGTLEKLDRLFDIAADFESNMAMNFLTSVIPGIICVGGVYFLHFGLVSGLVLYNVSLTAGMVNAMSPILFDYWRQASQRNRSSRSDWSQT